MAGRAIFVAIIGAASLGGAAHSQPQPPENWIPCPGHPRCPRADGTPPPTSAPPPASLGSHLIFFNVEDATLVEPARAVLDEAALRMRGTAGRILISGHDDSAGTDAESLALSQQRAAAVRDHLIALGIAPARLEIAAHGETQPLVMTADGVSEPLNRRVEITPVP